MPPFWFTVKSEIQLHIVALHLKSPSKSHSLSRIWTLEMLRPVTVWRFSFSNILSTVLIVILLYEKKIVLSPAFFHYFIFINIISFIYFYS